MKEKNRSEFVCKLSVDENTCKSIIKKWIKRFNFKRETDDSYVFYKTNHTSKRKTMYFNYLIENGYIVIRAYFVRGDKTISLDQCRNIALSYKYKKALDILIKTLCSDKTILNSTDINVENKWVKDIIDTKRWIFIFGISGVVLSMIFSIGFLYFNIFVLLQLATISILCLLIMFGFYIYYKRRYGEYKILHS